MKSWAINWPNFEIDGMGYQGNGTLVICENGDVMAATDYGDYVHRFHTRGFTPYILRSMIKRDENGAVSRIYNDYLLKKFSKRTEYMPEETLIAVVDAIKTVEPVADQLPYMAELDDYNSLETEEDFNSWAENTEIDDAFAFGCYDFSSQAYGFIQEILPHALELLIKEIEGPSSFACMPNSFCRWCKNIVSGGASHCHECLTDTTRREKFNEASISNS